MHLVYFGMYVNYIVMIIGYVFWIERLWLHPDFSCVALGDVLDFSFLPFLLFFFFKDSFSLLPRLECSDAITADCDCNLDFPSHPQSIWDPRCTLAFLANF